MARRDDGQLRDVRVPMFMAPADIDAIENWMAKNRVWSRSEAIRQLIEIALKAEFIKGL